MGFGIDGRVAIVTGAASGLGLAIATVLAQEGALVVLADKDAEGANRAAAALPHAVPATLDIADDAAVRALFADTAARHGRLDIVFANAGISAGPGYGTAESGRLHQLDITAFRRVVDVNLTANVLIMHLAAAHMKDAGGGSIVVTTSVAGLRADPMVGYAYSASKAALNNLVRQAAVDLAPHRVRVNAIAPGPFLTNIADGRLHRQPEVRGMFERLVPLGRLGDPGEIGPLALLLASDAGSFITGTVIPIDGGTTAR